jgi:putative glutamine amidotransferase
MTRPIIGISLGNIIDKNGFSCSNIDNEMLDSLILAGGAPVLIPVATPLESVKELGSRLQGLILTGGPDIDTEIFGGEPHPKVYGIDRQRDDLEIALAQMAYTTGLPVMGICRGFQVMNVAMGGKLLTHIKDQLPGALDHSRQPGRSSDWLAHPVKIEKNSSLEKIVGSSQPQVNSMHHQGVLQAPAGLRALAYAPDGIVESVEMTGHPFALGIQWHPECLQEYPNMQNLFRALVQAASN